MRMSEKFLISKIERPQWNYLWVKMGNILCLIISYKFKDWGHTNLKHASITWTRQIAHVSHSTSQLHIATAFHFFIENSFSELAWPSIVSCSWFIGWDSVGVGFAILKKVWYLKSNLEIHWWKCIGHFYFKTKSLRLSKVYQSKMDPLWIFSIQLVGCAILKKEPSNTSWLCNFRSSNAHI